MNWLLIALGGALGSLLRYGCSRLLNGPSFPYGTLAINIAGSLLIGSFIAWFSKEEDAGRRLLLVTGFCGGFTTFSAFSLEALQLLQQAKFLIFFLYTFASIGLGISATYLGFKLFQ